jgi:hypothetical protein
MSLLTEQLSSSAVPGEQRIVHANLAALNGSALCSQVSSCLPPRCSVQLFKCGCLLVTFTAFACNSCLVCSFLLLRCSNEQPLAPQQLFLMSLICNVHPSSQFLDVLPTAHLQQPLGGAALAAGQQQQLQMQREAAAAAGDEELLQVPIRLGTGPVVAGSEAPGEPL